MSEREEELRRQLVSVLSQATSILGEFVSPTQQQPPQSADARSSSSAETTTRSTGNEIISEHRRLFRTPSSTVVTRAPSSTVVTRVAQEERAFAPIPGLSRSRLHERRQRYNPYINMKPAKSKMFSKTIVVLTETDCTSVPTGPKRTMLIQNGMWKEKILFPCGGSHDDTRDVLKSNFPQLQNIGSIELLKSSDGSRTRLEIFSTGYCCCETLKVVTSGRIYVRPIQENITLETDQRDKPVEYDTCRKCDKLVNVADLRHHVEMNCKDESDNDDDLVPAFVTTDESLTSSLNVEGSHESAQEVDTTSGVVEDVEVSLNSSVTVEGSHELPQDVDNISGMTVEAVEERNGNIPGCFENKTDVEQTIADIVLQACQKEPGREPTAIIKAYQSVFFQGRPLDVSDEATPLVGDTCDIFVSRDRLWETAVSELTGVFNIRNPLSVMFYDEEAEDVGGPRKEFLTSAMDVIKQQIMESHDSELKLKQDDLGLARHHFFVAGLICGLSILEGGPRPYFVHSVIQGRETEEKEQFLSGFKRTGLLQLMDAKPSIKFMFMPGADQGPLTMRIINGTLKPDFSIRGSVRREKEEDIYAHFIRYLREVAGGRRGNVTLEKVLQFATSVEKVPILGFNINPSIKFPVADNSYIPTASTCTNVMYLPVEPLPPVDFRIPENLFELYDFAFTNAYFGLR